MRTKLLRAGLALALLLALGIPAPAQVTTQQFSMIADMPANIERAGASVVGATGVTDLYYWIAAHFPAGIRMPYGPVIARRTVGIAGLTGANYVAVSWTGVSGATGYSVIRQTALSPFQTVYTCTACVVSLNAAAVFFNDTGGGVVNWPPAGAVWVNQVRHSSTINNRDEAAPYFTWDVNGFPGRLVYTTTYGGTLPITNLTSKIAIGSAASYFTTFSSGDTIIGVWAQDTTLSAETIGIGSQLRTAAPGGGSLYAFRGQGSAMAGTSMAFNAGGYFRSYSGPGAGLVNNAYGAMGETLVDLTATRPIYASGLYGILDTSVDLVTGVIRGAVVANVRRSSIAASNFDGAFVAFRNTSGTGIGGTEGAAFKARQLPADVAPSWSYGLDLYQGAVAGGVPYGSADIRGGRQCVLDNEGAYLWRSACEARVGGVGGTYVDWSARTDAAVYGMRSMIASNLGKGTLTVYGIRGQAQAAAATAGGVLTGVAGLVETAVGVVGTDVIHGVYGVASPSVGLVIGSYGVRGDLRITGTAAAGANMLLAGVKGEYDDAVGIATAATSEAAVLSYIEDRNTIGPDGAFVALLAGGGVRQAANNPVAAYAVADQNAAAGVGFLYGLDLYWNNGAGLTNVFEVADIRGQNQATLSNPAASTWRIQDNAAAYFQQDVYSAAVAATAPAHNIRKGRGTAAVPVLVVNADALGTISFSGWDGAAFQPAASITAGVDAAAGAGDMPGNIVFSTTPDGAVAPVARLGIGNTGIVSFNTNQLIVSAAGRATTYGALTTAGMGVPPVLVTYSALDQAAAIGVANLLAAAPVGQYRASTYIHTTVADGGVCTATVILGWTYNAGAKVKSVIFEPALVNTHDLNTDEAASDNTTIINVDAGANITREVTRAGACAGASRYDLFVTLERLL